MVPSAGACSTKKKEGGGDSVQSMLVPQRSNQRQITRLSNPPSAPRPTRTLYLLGPVSFPLYKSTTSKPERLYLQALRSKCKRSQTKGFQARQTDAKNITMLTQPLSFSSTIKKTSTNGWLLHGADLLLKSLTHYSIRLCRDTGVRNPSSSSFMGVTKPSTGSGPSSPSDV